jgi:hypothetical protein
MPRANKGRFKNPGMSYIHSMRLSLIVAFAAGLVLKLMHIPLHTLLLLVVVAVGIGTSVPGLRGERKAEAWCRMAFWTWLLHLVALLKLFPFRTGTLLLAAAISVVALILALRQRPVPTALRHLAGAFVVIMLALAIPTSTRFHFTNLRFSLERDTDHITWDKYSFLLLREGRTNEALAANGAAVEAAMASHDEEAVEQLRTRRESIERNSWERYTSLVHGH